MHGFKCYHYEPLDPALLPPIYLAYHDALSEPTEVFHNDIRGRFDRGEEKVVNAMKHFAELAAAAREALLDRDADRLGQLMDENFDTRRSIYNLPPWQVQMVETARRCGASAKFAGSGGAIIGTYRDEAMFEQLCQALRRQHGARHQAAGRAVNNRCRSRGDPAPVMFVDVTRAAAAYRKDVALAVNPRKKLVTTALHHPTPPAAPSSTRTPDLCESS